MDTLSGSTVTIDRVHFETILRRANFSPDDVTSPAILVSKSEYDGLQTIAAKYANLRQNLLRGGVGSETIDLLSQDDATIEQKGPSTASVPSPTHTAGQYNAKFQPDVVPANTRPPKTTRRFPNDCANFNAQSKPLAHSRAHQTPATPNWADAVHQEEEEESVVGGGLTEEFIHYNQISHQRNAQAQAQAQAQTQALAPARPSYERQCDRSLLFGSLAEGTTHLDVTEATRGGQLLDIYMRANERMAAVSFVHAADAQAFFEHVRRHDLYIRNKRVSVRWHDRQFIMPGHISSKIATGATRNLVIRRCNPSHTAAAIRDDLEHIHNLVVIKLEFIGSSCHIKTNSVQYAIFARTCMMSRLKYRHSRIDWDVDECCQPLEQPAPAKPQKEAPSLKRGSSGATMANRFHLLDLDDGDEEEVLSSSFSPSTTVGIAT